MAGVAPDKIIEGLRPLSDIMGLDVQPYAGSERIVRSPYGAASFADRVRGTIAGNGRSKIAARARFGLGIIRGDFPVLALAGGLSMGCIASGGRDIGAGINS